MRLSESLSIIRSLESLNVNDPNAYEFACSCFMKINKPPVFLCEVPAGQRVIHSRTHESEDFFCKISDISLPPEECVKNYGRCNRPKQAVFYCSENRPTSYIELLQYWAESKQYGDKLKVTLGQWRLKTNALSVIVTSPNEKDRVSNFDKIHGAAFDKELVQFEGEELKAYKLFFKYLFDKFRMHAKHDIKTYIITSSYCNLALQYSIHKPDAILYPSVPYAGEGVNFCFKSDFLLQDNIELISVFRNEFEIIENEEKKPTFTEVGCFEAEKLSKVDDKIVWKNKKGCT